MAKLPGFHQYDVYEHGMNAIYSPRFGVAQDQFVIAAASKIEEISEPDDQVSANFPDLSREKCDRIRRAFRETFSAKREVWNSSRN